MRILKCLSLLLAALSVALFAASPAFAQKKPNVVMLMSDDTGWSDFGAYLAAARRSAIRRRTSIASPRKARCSRAGTARRAAPRAAPRS